MRKSLYRKIILCLNIGCFALLFAIANSMGAFAWLRKLNVLKIVKCFFSNSYVCGILCSIFAVSIIYVVQISHSKRMIKRDFRCNEVMMDIDTGIEHLRMLSEKVPLIVKPKFNSSNSLETETVYEFFRKHKADFFLIDASLLNENNNILLNSVQSCFFLNLNFKLLGITNNIKNRLPNLQGKYLELSKRIDNNAIKNALENDSLEKLENDICLYLADLKFMAKYWKELLNYLRYDHTFNQLLIESYSAKFIIDEDIIQPENVLYSHIKEAIRDAKRAMWKRRIKRFWMR